jgi:hypothetical protein
MGLRGSEWVNVRELMNPNFKDLCTNESSNFNLYLHRNCMEKFSALVSIICAHGVMAGGLRPLVLAMLSWMPVRVRSVVKGTVRSFRKLVPN